MLLKQFMRESHHSKSSTRNPLQQINNTSNLNQIQKENILFNSGKKIHKIQRLGQLTQSIELDNNIMLNQDNNINLLINEKSLNGHQEVNSIQSIINQNNNLYFKQEYNKLDEITNRCFDYKSQFCQNLENQRQKFRLLFKQSHNNLNKKCQEIISRINQKKLQIETKLLEQQKKIEVKIEQIFKTIQLHIVDIKKHNNKHKTIAKFNEVQLAAYANSIKIVYEKVKYYQNDSKCFLNKNILTKIQQQICSIQDKSNISRRNPQLFNSNISFTNENMFTCQKKLQFLQNLEKAQNKRQNNLKVYKEKLQINQNNNYSQIR